MNVEQGFDISDVLGVARRRGKLIAIVAAAFILAAFWISMALPNFYTSSAVILVEPQSVDEGLINSGVRESDLNERLGLMTAEILSRSRLSKIIDDVGLYKAESRYLERQEVIDLMRSYVSVEPVLNELDSGTRRREVSFNTFKITFRNENAKIASEVAQRIANDFINVNIESRTNITAKSLDFMQDEIDSLSTEIAKIERSIAEVKVENPGRLPEDMTSNQRTLQFTMADLRDAQRIVDSAQSDAAFWKNQAISASSLDASTDATSPGYRMRRLELDLKSAIAQGYTERHPDVVRIQSEIDLLKQQVEKLDSEEDGATRSLAEQNARSEQRRAELRATSAADDVERLRTIVAELENRLAATPSVAERLDALNRQYEHLNRSYQDFSKRRQQAGVQSDLERRQLGEKFRILEQAFPASAPSSPNRILLLAMGSILGLLLGGGIGLLAEMSDSSLHTSNDLQSAIGIPVLVSVPNIMLESDRAERTRRIWRETIAAAAVVAFCLVGGVVTYLFVNGTGSSNADSVVEEDATVETEARTFSVFGIDLG